MAALQSTDAERLTRIDLAAAFRLAAQRGWEDLLFQHISARSPDHPQRYLMNPPDLLFEEITASKIHVLGQDGKHLLDSSIPTHMFSFPMHRSVYDAVPDAKCVLHLHTESAVAVSMQQQGLLYNNQYSLWVGKISVHEYEGFLTGPHEAKKLVECFKTARVTLLRAHGLIVWGESVSEAYLLSYLLNRACEIQVMSLNGAIEPYRVGQEIIDRVSEEARGTWAASSIHAKMTWQALLRKLRREAPDFEA
jgi:ribulose-5-phosphate 4-epimerase/fuculose-1-phosphate aldolase